MAEMTPRQRWLAAVTMQPVDRLPFWPKIDRAYPRAQAAPFCHMSLDEIHDWIGSDKHVWVPTFAVETYRRCSKQMDGNGDTRRTVFRTPYGDLVRIDRFDVDSQAWHPVKFPIETAQDIEWLTAFFEDATAAVDPVALHAACETVGRYGEDAITCMSIGTSALMDWVEHLAGIEAAHLMLADYPDRVQALFEAIHQLLQQKVELVAERSPVDMLYMTENTSTTLTSPWQYMEYCYPHIMAYGRIAQRHGRLMALHMCGHLKLLLPDLATLPVNAFEAFTSPTLGNTTLLDGRSACPDKALIGGTNAMLWTRPASEITAQIAHDLAELPHQRGIAVTSAGVMPPLCPPERIKAVCEQVRAYPART